MNHNVPNPWRHQSQALFAKLAAQCDSTQGQEIGSTSSSLYDTAWLSMVRKQGSDVWLFPECFEFVLSQQLTSGAWESYSTPVDGILNTAVALLSLTKHLQIQPGNHDWQIRSHKAKGALEVVLGKWDLRSTYPVGQELLIISLLSLLQENGVTVPFSQLSALQAAYNAEPSKIRPSTVREGHSALRQSLEAFNGHSAFNRISQWRERNGSFMNSPAATAAYLIHSQSWDEDAESYLKNVINRNGGLRDGGVPCAWPMNIFEVTRVVSTLAVVGVSPDPPEALVFSGLLNDTRLQQEGLLGFAPGILPDVDHTAKGIEALHHLGHETSVNTLIETFESDEYFLTYAGEPNPAFSANCSVLKVLLIRDGNMHHVSQIAKTVKFLVNWAFKGRIRDTMNRHELYWMMLLAQAFELLYHRVKIAQKIFEDNPDLQEQVPMLLLQLLMRILHTQQSNGSWDGVCEITSYAVLALSYLLRLPFVRQLDKGQIVSKIALGKSFLYTNRDRWAKGEYLWLGKVTYGSDMLSEAHCLAASSVSVPFMIEPEPSTVIGSFLPEKGFLVPESLLTGMRKTGDLLAQTPLLRNTQPSTLRIVEMQACFATQALQQQPPNIFPRAAKGRDKYSFVIALALALCAEAHSCSTSLFVLYEMMLLSILNFHADEYMEGFIEKYFAKDLNSVRQIVEHLFVDVHANMQNDPRTATQSGWQNPNRQATDIKNNVLHNALEYRPSLQDVRDVLSRFVRQILGHPAVLSSPARLQTRLAFDLKIFLLSHITQAEDNCRLRAGLSVDSDFESRDARRGDYHRPGRSFYRWVRDVSADHTSCPFSFVFFECLVHAAPSCPVQTRTIENTDTMYRARTAYLAEDTCRHLASLCRMYNDYGSLARDVEEHTLNSVNFPEFSRRPGATLAQGTTSASIAIDDAKSELLWIAEYERRGLDTAMKLLEKELGPGELIDAIRVFIDVTDLYGQIYILKDIGTRT
ncbi:hypothetical protein F5Y01DRAFT_323101 [Xylaria sp. FL0043]|nr:hypothetical protein F5Y01DRAFT_323101 [Xylaria sp. FL0043]